MKSFFLLALVLFLGVRLNGQAVLLSDDFNGGSIDGSKWQTILPFGATISQSDGVVTTTQRGVLATANPFPTPYVISGTFTMRDNLEHFNILFRSDLSASSFNERPGLFVSFSNDSDVVSIQRYTNSADWDLLANTNFSQQTGTPYDFTITDTGSIVTLAINGTSVLSAVSSYATGDFIGFYSREFGDGTQIDSVTISTIPETSGYAAVLGLAGLVAAKFRKRRHGCIRNGMTD